MIRKLLISVLSVFALSCDSPFNTKEDGNNVFELTITHNITRVMPTALVYLSWTEITVENFSSYRIERKTTIDTSWSLISEPDNEFLTSYIDTIGNDEDLLYRIGIVNTSDDIVWANGSTNIPRTTSAVVPDEYATIQTAFNSDLIDDGDTILVKQGIYVETLGISGKEVIIISIDGYEDTILQPSFTEDPNIVQRVVSISSGILDGFTIELGRPSHGANGGGVVIAQDATLINCYISENESLGRGGGIFITERGNLYNCIVTGDTASMGTGIYILNGHGEIINNTFAYNSLRGDEVVLDGDCSGLIFRNNIILNPTAAEDLCFININDTTGVIIDYLLVDTPLGFGKNIIVGDPLFNNNIQFNLLNNSPGIDTGHPADKYNDIDGTRNDIGAYGGPRNKK